MAVRFIMASAQTIAMGSGSNAARNIVGVTLMCWYKPIANNSNHALVSLSSGTSATRSRCKVRVIATGAIDANGRCKDADSNRGFVGTAGKVSAGSWQHICSLHDYTNKKISLYYNGTFDAISAALAWGDAPTSDTASLAFNIGSQHNGGSEYANGDIEDARVYNRLLSEAEIQTIYAANGCDNITYGLQHRYLLRENAPGVVVSSKAGSVKDMGSLQKNNASQTHNPTYREGQVNELAILHAL